MFEALESGTSSESECDSPDESYSKDSSNASPIKSSTSKVSNSSSDVPFTEVKASTTKGSTNSMLLSDSKKTSNNGNIIKKKEAKHVLLSDSDTEENKVLNSKNLAIDENSNSSDVPLIKFIRNKEKVEPSDKVGNPIKVTSNAETKSKEKITLEDPSVSSLSASSLETSDSDVEVSASKSSTKKNQLTNKEEIDVNIKSNNKKKKVSRINRKNPFDDSDSDEKNSTKNEDECQIADPASGNCSSDNDTKAEEQSPASNKNRPGPASSKKRFTEETQSTKKQPKETEEQINLATKNNRPGPASSKKRFTEKSQSAKKQPEETEEQINLARKGSGESDSRQLQLSKIKRKLEVSSDDNDTDGNTSLNEESSTKNKDECHIIDPTSKSCSSYNDTEAKTQSPVSRKNRPGPASSKKNVTEQSQSTNKKQPGTSGKRTNLKRKRSDESDSRQLQPCKVKRKLDISSGDNDSEGDVSMGEKDSNKSEDECQMTDSTSESCSSDKDTKANKRTPAPKKNRPDSTKKNPITDENISKPPKTKNEKLDDSDILERLEGASDSDDDSSEDSDTLEKPEGAVDSDDDSSEDGETDQKSMETDRKESTKSNFTKTKKESKIPQKNGRKVVPKKNQNAVKNTVSKSDDDSSDDAKPTNESKRSKEKSFIETQHSPISPSSNDSINNSPSEITKRDANKSEKLNKNDSKKEMGKKIGENPRIARLQRYLKEAGIRVKNYKTLWQGCKSEKARAEKLLELLHERGLKGKPSVSECRKLKRKYEREKEISELNTSNIISTTGRSRRGTASLFASSRSPSEKENITKQELSRNKSPEFKKIFGRLRTIVDSEDSD